jgi:yecA family protein
MSSDMPDYPAIQNAVKELRLPVSAAELHGALSGCLCAGAELTPGNWLAYALTDAEQENRVVSGSDLARFYFATVAQLAGDVMDFEFDLFLPEDETPVSERGPAMVEWCRGFLGGFGVVPAPSGALSEEAEEALQDLAKIAASDLNYEETEADEEALIEVCEYIRVAAVLLYNERVVNRRQRQRLN